MKHYFQIIISILLFTLISGCALKKVNNGEVNENSVNFGAIPYNDSQITGRINDIRFGLTPQVKPTGNTEVQPEEEKNQQNKSPNDQKDQQQVKLEDLAITYKHADIKTNYGDITVQFYATDSPLTVNNFLNLAKAGFYNGTKFHRVIKGFMIQGGDPMSRDNDWSNDGTGGPGYAFKDEINSHKLVEGSLAMANSGPNTNGSQFFIITRPGAPDLDGKHTNFGMVIKGMDIVKKIEAVKTNDKDHPIDDVIITNILLQP